MRADQVDPVSQERVIRAACADAGVSPLALSAVEMHGTGTRLGDPVECDALVTALGGPEGTGPCYLTAAKMHFGHLESAAGAVGLLKAVLMLERQTVPGFAVDSPGAPPGSQLNTPPWVFCMSWCANFEFRVVQG